MRVYRIISHQRYSINLISLISVSLPFSKLFLLMPLYLLAVLLFSASHVPCWSCLLSRSIEHHICDILPSLAELYQHDVMLSSDWDLTRIYDNAGHCHRSPSPEMFRFGERYLTCGWHPAPIVFRRGDRHLSCGCRVSPEKFRWRERYGAYNRPSRQAGMG